jgi:hypothetical protein
MMYPRVMASWPTQGTNRPVAPRETGPWLAMEAPSRTECEVVTVDVLPSQLEQLKGLVGESEPETQLEVDQMLLRPACVEAYDGLCIMAMGHFYMG